MTDEGYSQHPKRNIVPCNTARVDGIYLEDVPEVSPGVRPGVVIVLQDWPFDMFLMKKRNGWTHEDVYKLADELIAKKNIFPKSKNNLQ